MVCSVLRLDSMMFPPSGTGAKIRQRRYLSVYSDCWEQSAIRHYYYYHCFYFIFINLHSPQGLECTGDAASLMHFLYCWQEPKQLSVTWGIKSSSAVNGCYCTPFR